MTHQQGSSTAAGELPASVRRAARALWAALIVASCAACAPDSPRAVDHAIRVGGECMGTTWSLVAVPGSRGGAVPPTAEDLARVVQAQFDEVDAAMSTWKPDSELSRFNRLDAGESLPVGEETAWVARIALDVFAATEGAFDPTVGPLVAAWGFGAGARGTEPPGEEDLAARRATVGLDGLTLSQGPGRAGVLQKLRDGLELDFSAVAKGFAVDEGARALEALDLDGYFLELGGEVRVDGRSPRGDGWRVGIDRPVPSDVAGGGRAIALVVSPSRGAVATSGDYRNWRVVDGRRVGHTLDPRSGRPVVDGPASVTVAGPSCAVADAWATALMVLGPDAGLPLVEALDDYEALFLVPAASEHGDGGEGAAGFTERATSGFDALRVKAPVGG